MYKCMNQMYYCSIFKIAYFYSEVEKNVTECFVCVCLCFFYPDGDLPECKTLMGVTVGT